MLFVVVLGMVLVLVVVGEIVGVCLVGWQAGFVFAFVICYSLSILFEMNLIYNDKEERNFGHYFLRVLLLALL